MNIALRIQEQARLHPEKKSVIFGDSFYTFREFEERSNQMAYYFESIGITKGTRTLLFVKPCLDFSVITFSLFKIGAIPVLIDPGMGIKNLLRSVSQVRPEALIAIDLIHWIRRIKRAPFSTVKIHVSLDPLYKNLQSFSREYAVKEMRDDENSAILFTSGGTGIPKGVQYTHGILNAQTDILKELFHLDYRDTDLPGFPLFALFTLAMGMTSIIPDMDPTKPVKCDPQKLVSNILKHQVTFCAGSPAIWERVGRYCLKNNIQLGSVKYIVMFGAPVETELHQLFKKILTQGDTYTPYGATECLPVSLMSGKDVLSRTAHLSREGLGTCIGKPVPGAEVKIIKTTDIPERELIELPTNSVGEIVVAGPMVTPAYFEMPEETHKAKIHSGNKLWHRMGDNGRIDSEGNLWFLGRKSHRVVLKDRVLESLQVEAIFNQHPAIKRSALINFHEAPGLVIERHDGNIIMTAVFLSELVQLGQTNQSAALVKDFWLSAAFPVDVRHNIKIDRLALSAEASSGNKLCQKNLSRRSHASSI